MSKKVVLAVSVTEEEKDMIMEAAQQEGRTASGYVRHVVLSEIRKNNQNEVK